MKKKFSMLAMILAIVTIVLRLAYSVLILVCYGSDFRITSVYDFLNVLPTVFSWLIAIIAAVFLIIAAVKEKPMLAVGAFAANVLDGVISLISSLIMTIVNLVEGYRFSASYVHPIIFALACIVWNGAIIFFLLGQFKTEKKKAAVPPVNNYYGNANMNNANVNYGNGNMNNANMYRGNANVNYGNANMNNANVNYGNVNANNGGANRPDNGRGF